MKKQSLLLRMKLKTLVILKARLEGDQSFEGGVFDVLKMNAMISLHDIEENIVGDERFKDKQYYRTEQKALDTVAEGVSDLNIGSEIVSLINEYKGKASPEARFVKAIDELQAWFYMVYTKRFDKSTRDFNQPEEIKGYLLMQEFPVLKRIADILLNILQHPQRYSDKIVDLDLIRQQYESH
jgi:5'-deoxynucleotidase YfbR-like HD superfamily hydrolase